MFRKAFAIAIGLALVAGTAFAGSQSLTESEMDGVSAQGLQTVHNDNRWFGDIDDQNNNLDSVQINENGQQSTNVWGIVNSAKSAVNTSANVLIDGPEVPPGPEPPTPSDKSFSSIYSQSNDNVAVSHVNKAVATGWGQKDFTFAVAANKNKQTQWITNTPESVINGQNNNNNSVQLNDNAQEESEGYSIVNASTSALNLGVNIFVAGDVSGTTGSQSNNQVAKNMGNTAIAKGATLGSFAIAMNKEWNERGTTQTIDNQYHADSFIGDQDNNNNSVQVNDNAQEDAIAESIINAAQSAVNASANLASMAVVSGSDLSQSNDNKAENHVNLAMAFSSTGHSVAVAANKNKQTQHVLNAEGGFQDAVEIIEDQDNNNNSVQVNNNGQRAATGILLENSANSATNAALNLMGTGNVTASTLSQSNTQVARNFENVAFSNGLAIAGNAELGENPGQYIHNVHVDLVDQDNNNNSVQLNNHAQQDIVVDKTINSANSAVNLGQNIMSTGDVTGSTITQTNWQYAGNHNNLAIGKYAVATNLNKQTQLIDNCFCTILEGEQDNNMNSVQLNNHAQQNAMGVVVVNAADSAVNGALNILTAGIVSTSNVTQSNTNVAINFSNVAIGSAGAIAVNAEGISFGF